MQIPWNTLYIHFLSDLRKPDNLFFYNKKLDNGYINDVFQ